MIFSNSVSLAEAKELLSSDIVEFPVGNKRVVKFRPSGRYMGAARGYDHQGNCQSLNEALRLACGQQLSEFIKTRYDVAGGVWPELYRGSGDPKEWAKILKMQCYDIMKMLESNKYVLDNPADPSHRMQVTEMERAEALYQQHIAAHSLTGGSGISTDPIAYIETKSSPKESDKYGQAADIISHFKSKKDGRSKKVTVIKVRRTDCKIERPERIRRTAIRR